MTTVEIVEREGSGLYQALRKDMRTGSLRTFSLKDRGRKVIHVSAPGRMTWRHSKGTIRCDIPVLSRGEAWQFLSHWIGRLADRYSSDILSMSIRFGARSRKK